MTFLDQQNFDLFSTHLIYIQLSFQAFLFIVGAFFLFVIISQFEFSVDPRVSLLLYIYERIYIYSFSFTS